MAKNSNSKQILIVGDVHGCFFEFLELLKKAQYHQSTHRLLLTGDLVSKGPHSLKMLEWVKKEQVEVVRGNHDDLLVKSIQQNLASNPFIETLKQEMGAQASSWADWISTWPYFIEDKDFLLVHGGLAPSQHPQKTKPFILMNVRTWDLKNNNIGTPHDSPWYDFYKENKLVVYGHWARQGLKIRSNTIGLDSGCVYGHALSGVLLPQKKIIQVPAQKKYCEPQSLLL